MPCLNGGNCTQNDTNGEYVCSCSVGYTGFTCDTDIDDVYTNVIWAVYNHWTGKVEWNSGMATANINV
uniref:EGF-like domain-containing protein n=1 Tax=Amphimedon queenslandica TaxID=400682 RepID=A0A1X7V1Q0_AMPQE